MNVVMELVFIITFANGGMDMIHAIYDVDV
jgi:hypothetical protein